MCQVVEATGFGEAKALLDTQSFDMAILDIMGVEGFKLLEIANKKGYRRHVDRLCAESGQNRKILQAKSGFVYSQGGNGQYHNLCE
jgi:DNA-binding response OmpR family regulator